jgi:hypothetical protein
MRDKARGKLLSINNRQTKVTGLVSRGDATLIGRRPGENLSSIGKLMGSHHIQDV